ncbi:hypothetical protein V1508DRAFT_406954 [Lipomyces doorenjongii]|uniref:uncharacterized protein n=1 Tax=Lipomyces doorenjongii TaxID=383834 RepID=UPI0034CD5B7B
MGAFIVPLRIPLSNHRTFVIPLALALLDRGYNPKSLSDDLWMKLANDKDRLDLSQLIFPVDGSFHNVSSLSGISPIEPRSWKDVATRFQRSIFLDELHDWTYSFLVDMLIPMKTKGKTPTPSEVRRLQVAHIMPFSASKRKPLRNLLSVFAGEDMEELLTGSNINDPSNALLLDAITHEAFDSFEFGLEFQNKCGIAGLIDKILQDEEEFNIGNVEGDYWLRVSASYLQRELRGLQEVDDSAI